MIFVTSENASDAYASHAPVHGDRAKHREASMLKSNSALIPVAESALAEIFAEAFQESKRSLT